LPGAAEEDVLVEQEQEVLENIKILVILILQVH
jgi:hypothetical protein